MASRGAGGDSAHICATHARALCIYNDRVGLSSWRNVSAAGAFGLWTLDLLAPGAFRRQCTACTASFSTSSSLLYKMPRLYCASTCPCSAVLVLQVCCSFRVYSESICWQVRDVQHSAWAQAGSIERPIFSPAGGWWLDCRRTTGRHNTRLCCAT
jgi:hypothetical protein